MTKLEFLDKINDILIGLNTAESDALGSLYDELMSDAGWHPASELPTIPKGEDEVEVYCLVHGKGLTFLVPMKLHYTISRGFGVSESIKIKWWCYPPKEEE